MQLYFRQNFQGLKVAGYEPDITVCQLEAVSEKYFNQVSNGNGQGNLHIFSKLYIRKEISRMYIQKTDFRIRKNKLELLYSVQNTLKV